MVWNTFFNVHEAKWLVLTDGGKYTKLVRANDPTKTFEYFLNPAAFSGVSGEVYFDGTSFKVSGASELDDRYSVGKNVRLVFGGSNSYPVFDVSVDLSAYTLTEVLTDARILPGLVVSFSDKRLASNDYYLLVFSNFWSVVSNILSGLPNNTDKDNYVLSLLNPNGLLQHFLTNWSSYSSAFYFETLPNRTIRLVPDAAALSSVYTHDGAYITSEERLYSFSSTLGTGHQLLSMILARLNQVTGGNERYTLYPYYDVLGKSLSGAYTILGRPERLVGFNRLVANAVSSLANTYVSGSANRQVFTQLANAILQEGLRDWFRPSTYRVVVGYNNGTPIYAEVNVFLAFHGANYSDGVVLVDFNGKQIGVPVSFGDTFSYNTGQFERAYPQGKQYVTGPYGHIPVYDANGNIIDWVPDAYAR